jgi:drug/metabolite transporter (DMT)-like permease
MAVFLALLASLIWGTSDFLGGTVTKKLSAVTTLLWANLLVLPGLLIVTLVIGDLQLTPTTIGWGIVAGISGSLGICALYQGLATGVMGVVAPIASTSVVLPVVIGVVTGESIGVVRGFGIAMAIAGIVLAGGLSVREFRSGGHRPLLFAGAAAILIGIFLVAMANGSQESALSTLLVMRVTDVGLLLPMVLVLGLTRVPGRSAIPSIAFIGAADLAANALYGFAVHGSEMAITAVLVSLYPVVTLLMARRINQERLNREQMIGVTLAMIGVAVVVLG